MEQIGYYGQFTLRQGVHGYLHHTVSPSKNHKIEVNMEENRLTNGPSTLQRIENNFYLSLGID
jgi:hypothetical protein